MNGKISKTSIIGSVMAFVILLVFLCVAFIVPTRANWIENLTLSQTITPFWKNEENGVITIYDEIVVPIEYGSSGQAQGFLTYTPSQILSVKNFSGEIIYTQDQYTLAGNKISFSTSSGLPYLKDEWVDNKNVPSAWAGGIIPSSYNDGGGTNNGACIISEAEITRTNHLLVTYTFDASQELGFTAPQFQPQNYPNLLTKLESGQPVKILVFGDSISVGSSASGFVGFAPYLPTWFNLIKEYLVQTYYQGDQSKVTIENQSVGGVTSSYGVKALTEEAFDKTGYDLIIIGFGMNDGSQGVNEYIFSSNISMMIGDLRGSSPKADFIVLGNFTPNPKTPFYNNLHSLYMPRLENIATELNLSENEQSGCTFVNMYDISSAILSKKQANNSEDGRYQYLDISANYANHPNDFMVRLYAGAILSTFINF